MNFEEAQERARFDLSYKKSHTQREFCQDGTTGEMITCAYSGKPEVSGEWYHNFPGSDEDVDWFRYFLRAVVAEVVHEGLEWFKVDGRCFLDPHGAHEFRIHAMCDEFADRLYALTTEVDHG